MDSVQTIPQQLADVELLKCLQDCPDLNVRDINVLLLLYIYIYVCTVIGVSCSQPFPQ